MAAANVPPTAPMPDGAGDDLEAADTEDQGLQPQADAP
jgi:hypothetical protein